MFPASKRLVADPTVGVADLMQPLERLLKKEDGLCGFNMVKHMQPSSGVSWKSATPVEWLWKHRGLFTDYVLIAKNSIISGKKHKTALEKLDTQYHLIQGKKTQEDGVDYLDDIIRMGLSHLRQMKQMPEKAAAAMRRCTTDQQKDLNKILELIDVGRVPCTDIVVFEGGSSASAATSSQEQADHGQEVKETLALENDVRLEIFKDKKEKPEKVFDRVLKEHVSTPEPRRKKETEESPFQCSLELQEGDEELLQAASKAKPLWQNGKSQQQRLNAVRKKPAAKKKAACPKPKAKGKARATKSQQSAKREKKKRRELKKRFWKRMMKRPRPMVRTLPCRIHLQPQHHLHPQQNLPRASRRARSRKRQPRKLARRSKP